MIIPFLFILFGISFLVGLWFAVKTVNFLRTATSTTGTVVGSERYITAVDMDMTDSAVFSFKAEDGKSYTAASRVATIFKKPIGKKYEILYNPKDPTDAVINSFVELHMPWIILVSVGSIGIASILLTSKLYG